MSNFRTRDFLESLTYAVQGFVYAYRTQRNLRIHILMGILVVILAAALRLTRLELAILALAVGAVIGGELINTAIESVVDLITKEYHPLAATAKNVAAAAVLTLAVAASGVGYFLFVRRLSEWHETSVAGNILAPPYAPFIAIALVLMAVASIKASKAVIKMQGGMPSGHAAVAFSLATAVFFISESGVSVLLSTATAGLVAQSRVEGKIHTFFEVVAGAFLGILVTAGTFLLTT